MLAMRELCTLLILTALVNVFHVTAQQTCGSQHVTITHENEDQLLSHVLNPGRGLYIDSVTSASYFHPLTKDHLRCLTDNHGTNLMLRMYSLDAFADGSPISQDFLRKLQHDLEAAKQAGWSLVLRFLYINNLDSQYSPQSEPTINQIENHITQLAPYISQYNGVVVAIQAGFHGEYGLWYTPGTNTNTQDTGIIAALQQNINIPIQVPNPDYKIKLGSSVDGSKIGHYHECLLKDDANSVTFAFPDLNNNQGALTYMKNDTAVIGGRTCHPGDTTNPPRNLCPKSEKLFKDIHLTYLNGVDPDETVQNYDRYGCLEKISNMLGYRLALESVSLPGSVSLSGQMCVAANISNRGYAAPFRNYNVSFILRNTADMSMVYEAPVSSDTTKWLPGSDATVSATFDIPSSLPAGQYDVYLKIFEPKFENDTDYYVHLSNSNPTYAASHGLNKLGTIQVVNGNGGSQGPSTSYLRPSHLPVDSNNPRIWQKNTRSCLQLPNGPPSSSGTATTSGNIGIATTNSPNTVVMPVVTTVTPLTTTSLPQPFVPFINDTSALEKCRKLDTVKALLQFTYISNPSTPDCPNSSSKATPEAIAVNFCNAPTNTIEWRPKGRVIDNCERIPLYARVAVFSSLNYYDYDTTSRKCGVFLGCIKEGPRVIGVKVGMQLCGRPFDIENAKFSNEKDLLNLYVF